MWDRAQRLGLLDTAVTDSSGSSGPLDIRLMVESNIHKIMEAMVEMQPAAVVIDSIQKVQDPDTGKQPGSVTQVCTY